MIVGLTHCGLPHPFGVPHLYVNRPLDNFNNQTQNVQWALYENLIYYGTQ